MIINEVAPASYMRGRTAKVPGPAPTPPAEVCLAFLDAVGRRDLDAAAALTGEDFTAALVDIGRHLGMFTDRVQTDMKVTGVDVTFQKAKVKAG